MIIGNVIDQLARGNVEAFNLGKQEARASIIARLNDYLELTVFSEEVEGAEPNPEWTAGFNAALALIKGENE